MSERISSDGQPASHDLPQLAAELRRWGVELGFQHVGIADVDLGAHPGRLRDWLAKGFHGEMEYMQRHAGLREHPRQLEPATLRVISARMDYLPGAGDDPEAVLGDGTKAYISRYALGRDYHKLLRKRLAQLAERLRQRAGGRYRAFVDSAPVLERAFAEKAGLGWIGKNTMLIHPRTGSWFFLGEIYTDLPLPVDAPQHSGHCGSCRACLDVCPTGAIVAPWQVDARRCISYLTIELRGAIPAELRPLIGNRVFGCDDCQLVCPWNKFARPAAEPGFAPRHNLQHSDLVELFGWSEADFEARTAGSAIRRIGYHGWLRNLAVALGNAPRSARVVAALSARREHSSELVREHVHWALARQVRREVLASDAGNP